MNNHIPIKIYNDKTIKELVIDLAGDVSQYIKSTFYNNYYDGSGYYCLSNVAQSAGVDSWFSLTLGSFFNNVKSCEIEVVYDCHGYRQTTTASNVQLYLWGSSLVFDPSSAGASDVYNYSGLSSVKQNTLFSGHMWKKGSTGSGYTVSLGVRIKSLKFKNVKFN